MRKIFFAVVLLCASAAMAQNETTTAILQHGSDISLYKGINAFVEAYTAAEDSDVITLSAGTFYSTPIAKSISIYGAGCMDDSLTNMQLTRLTSGIALGQSGDTLRDIHLEGLYIQGALDFIANTPVENFYICKCITGNLNFNSDLTNVTVSQCTTGTIQGTAANTANNLFIQNTVIGGVVQQFVLESSVLIDHCIIGGTTNRYTNIIACFTYKNSIFSATDCGRDEYFFARSGSVLYNCIYPTNTCYTSMSGDVVLHNCYGAGKWDIFTDRDNWIIAFPETWVGTDDTEIGIHGGIGWNRAPATPVINNLQLEVEGNTLNVSYDAEVR